MLFKTDTYRGQKRISDLMGLGWHVFVSCLLSVLETEFESSGRGTSTLNIEPLLQPHNIFSSLGQRNDCGGLWKNSIRSKHKFGLKRKL